MNKPLMVGDTLYAVYTGFKEPQVQTVAVKGVGKSGQISVARSGLAFDCRSRFSPEQVARYGRTEREAWEKFVDSREEQITALRKDIDDLYEEARFARTLIACRWTGYDEVPS